MRCSARKSPWAELTKGSRAKRVGMVSGGEIAHEALVDHLRHIRAAVDALREDMREVKERLGSLEANYASVSGWIDRLEGRVERIEKRLDLAEA